MANTPIGSLPAASVIQGTEAIPLVQGGGGGTTKQTQLINILSMIGNLTPVGVISLNMVIPINDLSGNFTSTFGIDLNGILGVIAGQSYASGAGHSGYPTKWSSNGGLQPKRLQVNQGSGSGLVMDTLFPVPLSLSFAGGSPTENFNVDLTPAAFATKPNWGIITAVDPHYNATFLVTDGGNTTTTAKCQLYHNDGTNVTAGTKLLMGFFAYLSNTPI